MERSSVKFVARNVVSWCVGSTVMTVVKNNAHSTSQRKRVENAVGGAAIALMIQEHVGTYTDRWIDAIYDAIGKQEDPVVLVH